MKCDRCPQDELEVRTVTCPDPTVLCLPCWDALQLWLRTAPVEPGRTARRCSAFKRNANCQLAPGHPGMHHDDRPGAGIAWL